MRRAFQKEVESKGKGDQCEGVDEQEGDNVSSDPVYHENIDAKAGTSAENVGEMKPSKDNCCRTQLAGIMIGPWEAALLLPEDKGQYNVGDGEDLEHNASYYGELSKEVSPEKETKQNFSDDEDGTRDNGCYESGTVDRGFP